MEPVVTQLKKDFQARIWAMPANNGANSTLSILTKEELNELENIWVQLVMWQKEQA
ncbi:hypothetical protein QWZ04_06005 [Vibrio tapetis subsp. quintayensis]|uniref:hypothetical protein n=1 Tax=Vibrio tapetis TaxID=52443 RepID=UPI0025B4491F|nr:hypothetical protein [Vibrio tapetis]MDN3679883.1 hypothetical protein [Vibrio tapetis subsp. quintayensis]